jgi:hypothetical protein
VDLGEHRQDPGVSDDLAAPVAGVKDERVLERHPRSAVAAIASPARAKGDRRHEDSPIPGMHASKRNRPFPNEPRNRPDP